MEIALCGLPRLVSFCPEFRASEEGMFARGETHLTAQQAGSKSIIRRQVLARECGGEHHRPVCQNSIRL